MFVVARQATPARERRDAGVVRAPDARYVVDGSLRKTGTRLRIGVRAIHAESGANLWAERYEYDAQDRLAAQDETAASVVGALVPTLERAEIDRAMAKPAHSLDAYDLTLRALGVQRSPGRRGNEEARALLERALALDPHFVPALVQADASVGGAVANGWLPEEALEGLLDRARLAVELAPDDAEALATLALRIAATAGDGDLAVALAGRAIEANPHAPSVWSRSGYALLYVGEAEQALASVRVRGAARCR